MICNVYYPTVPLYNVFLSLLFVLGNVSKQPDVPEAKMKEPEPYRDADIWFSETEEEEETEWGPTAMEV